MALLRSRGKLFAGVLFAGLLFGSQPEQETPQAQFASAAGAAPYSTRIKHTRKEVQKKTDSPLKKVIPIPKNISEEEDEEAVIVFVLSELYRQGLL